ncbi:MAG: GNAT family N-acetyltransferase [Eubacterium sp.]
MVIRKIKDNEIEKCVNLIKESFLTVASEFNITRENAPKYVAFSTTVQKLTEQFNSGKPMFAAFENDVMAGYFSLDIYDDICEINNLCVLPEFRHRKIGESLMKFALNEAKKSYVSKIKISIVDENKRLRAWYETFGFVYTHSVKYDFFPFTCGYMELSLK